MLSFFTHLWRTAERRLTHFSLEAPDMSVPEMSRGPEQNESLQSPEAAQREGLQRQEGAENDLRGVTNTLTSKEGVHIGINDDIIAALQTGTVDESEVLTVDTPDAEVILTGASLSDTEASVDDPGTEGSPEEVPETPQQKLWSEFIELSESLDSQAKVDALQQQFMEIPTDRAEAMLSVYEKMNVEERAQFDDVIIKNSKLLQNLSTDGFNKSLGLITAASNEERAKIIAGLPEADRQYIVQNWPADRSTVVREYFNDVDAVLVPAAAEEGVEPNAFEKIAQIKNSALRGFMQALAEFLYSAPVATEGFEHSDQENQDAKAQSKLDQLNQLREQLPEAEQDFTIELVDSDGTQHIALVFNIDKEQSTLCQAFDRERVVLLSTENMQRALLQMQAVESAQDPLA